MQPYTYLIKFIPTGQQYYGVRTANGCAPDELWIKYFTSSKIIKALIKEHGKESFEVVYTKNHETREDALKWEELFLVSVNAGNSDLWLNRHNGGKNFSMGSVTGENNPMYGKHHTEESRKKIGIAKIGKYTGEKNPMYGKTGELSPMYGKTGELSPMYGKTGEKNPMYGKKHTDDVLKKMSDAKIGKYTGELSPNFGKTGELSPNSKTYKIIFPDGHEEIIKGLVEFCRRNNLNGAGMTQVAQGKQKAHKGFRCEYYI